MAVEIYALFERKIVLLISRKNSISCNQQYRSLIISRLDKYFMLLRLSTARTAPGKRTFSKFFAVIGYPFREP